MRLWRRGVNVRPSAKLTEGGAPISAKFRGINVVSDGDEPLVNVPEPGGLPGAEPVWLTEARRESQDRDYGRAERAMEDQGRAYQWPWASASEPPVGAEPSIVHDPAQNVRVPGPGMCLTCGLPRGSCEPVGFWPECMVGLVGRNPHRCTDGFLGHIWDSLNVESARCLICGVPWSSERAYAWQLPAGEQRKPVQAERPAGVYR